MSHVPFTLLRFRSLPVKGVISRMRDHHDFNELFKDISIAYLMFYIGESLCRREMTHVHLKISL